MWVCILCEKQLEKASQNAQRRKVKQMQPMWLRFFSDKQLEDTFKNTQWGKIKQMQFQSYYSLLLTPERLLSWMDEHVVLEVGGQGLFLNFTKGITFWYRVASYTKCSFSGVSSNCSPEQIYNYIGCILAFFRSTWHHRSTPYKKKWKMGH